MDPNAQDQMIDQGAPQMMGPNPNPVGDGKPYFMGDHALIRFGSGEEGLGPETYWLVDKSNHTIRPFESPMALDAAFGQDLQAALQSLVTVSPPQIDAGGDITDGILQGFTVLGPEYAIKEDGSSKHLPFSNHQLQSRYGKPVNESLEELATEVVDGFMNLLRKNDKQTGVPANYIGQLKQDSQLMAFYISAMAYGDYTMQDIYSDICRRYHTSNK